MKFHKYKLLFMFFGKKYGFFKNILKIHFISVSFSLCVCMYVHMCVGAYEKRVLEPLEL